MPSCLLRNQLLDGLHVPKALLGQPSIVEQRVQRSLMYQHHGAQLILPLGGVQDALVLHSLHVLVH